MAANTDGSSARTKRHIDDDDSAHDDVLTKNAFHLLSESSPRHKSDSRRSVLLRAAHQQRLRSYRPDTYFSMPLELSPLLCSLCGWNVNEKEKPQPLSSSAVLSCRQCEAVTAIDIPSTLARSSPAYHKLVAHFRSQLWKTHAVHCRYQLEAKDLLDDDAKHRSSIVPVPLLRVVPSNTALELVVAASSGRGDGIWHVILPRFHSMFSLLNSSMANDGEGTPSCNVQLPATDHIVSQLMEESADTNQFDDETTVSKRLIERLETVIEQAGNEEEGGIAIDDGNRAMAWNALALVLFGWDTVANNTTALTIQCHCCLVRKSLLDGTTFPATTAHRYFCPWDCAPKGWTTVQQEPAPFWNVVVRAALRQPTPSLRLELPPCLGRSALSQKRRKLLALKPPETT